MQENPFPIIVCSAETNCEEVAVLINSSVLQIVSNTNESSYLAYKEQVLTLHVTKNGEHLSVSIDFIHGKSKHRRQYGGGKSQPLPKACGLDKHPDWMILDATAGLGKDAFVLASLGSNIMLCEQHPALYSMLIDAIHRANADEDVCDIVERMTCVFDDASLYLEGCNDSSAPDVVYLDPMYPERKKSAKIKKDMQILQSLVGYSGKESELLEIALKKSKHRVVVKRPKSAPTLNDLKPSYTVSSVNTRYDVYICG
ncbi:MAG: SAM-dependent methyltransferase [Cycloclasticus sp. symbiont of Bathymodiolus heckerae]|nr:MAG: SAM-dependent methyltransferase [Cycloclasticus sp. symbiont of Bathymodiolus heckerae]